MCVKSVLVLSPAWVTLYALARVIFFCGFQGINSEACLLTVLIWGNVFLSSVLVLGIICIMRPRIGAGWGLLGEALWSGAEVIFVAIWMWRIWDIVELFGDAKITQGTVAVAAWLPMLVVLAERLLVAWFFWARERGM